jgi:hypothetical protein
MSSNNNNVLSCKVCMDANKPVSVYSTHRVKQNGVVVCPTLLSQECKYCHKKGHTVKFCSTLKKENERKEKQLADGSADNKKKTQRVEFKDPISTINRFRVLEEQEETVCLIAPALNEVPHAYPALCAKTATVIAPMLGGYAAALKTPPKPKTQTQTQQIQTKTQTETHKKLFSTYDPTQKKSWSNCPDSDDEEEEEEKTKEATGTCAW